MGKAARNKKIKLKLSQALHRTLRVNLHLDIIVGEEIVEGYPASWVTIRGSEDPVYIKDMLPHVAKYQMGIDAAESIECAIEKTEYLADISKVFQTKAVTVAIIDWDEEFFEAPYSEELALELFSEDSHSGFYNEVANAMQQREDFLPIVSI